MEKGHAEFTDTNCIPSGTGGGFFIYDVNKNDLCFADSNVLELFGCENIDELRVLTSNSFIGMVHPDDRERLDCAIKEYNTSIRKPHDYIRYRIITKQGDLRYVEDYGHRLQSSDGELYCYVFIAGIDKAEFERAQRMNSDEQILLRADVNTDSLTGHLNMDAFGIKLKEMQNKEEKPVTVVIFDILGLSDINRTLGHAEGDARIFDLSDAVKTKMPDDCFIFRGYEGDIIAVCEDRDEESLAENIKNVIRVCKSPILYGIGSGNAGFINDASEILMERAYDEAQLDLKTKKLLNEKSHRSHSLITLIRTLEQVDSDTEAHVRRTQQTGIALGYKIGLSSLELSLLQLLCLLHDIGKITIPLEILNKPGKLTDDEWAMLRTHPYKGYQIAKTLDEVKPLADMILHHHERWDGRGYPAGLSGEDIPLLSRIISIVDTYDAMVNDRSYRKALSPEYAKQEIFANAGTQFDPILAQEFLELLEENPALSVGMKTGGKLRVFDNSITDFAGTGKTKPVVYSKYKLDLDNTIIEADDFFTDITGYTHDDAVGKMTQLDLVPEDERDFYYKQVKRQFAVGDIAYLRHPIQRKDGKIIDVICNGERYFDSSVRAFRSDILIFEVMK